MIQTQQKAISVKPDGLRIYKGLSKNFGFWTVSLDLDAMFKIKLLLYKDLILNSRGCRKSNQLLRHPRWICGDRNAQIIKQYQLEE